MVIHALVFPPQWGSSLDPKATVQFQMSNIADAINMFRARRRASPKSLDELTIPDEFTGEPYIERIPLDPWNQPYRYALLDPGTGTFRLWSAGPDRTFGTDDDLVLLPPRRD